MASVCFYFQLHQPNRLRRYSVFDTDARYFDEARNAEICRKIASKCYLPANRLLLDLIDRYDGQFRVAFSMSGVILDQLEAYAPEVVDSFGRLNDTGCVELLAETYYHSLAFLYSRDEFAEQVLLHRRRMRERFGVEPKVFRNTELIYSNELAHFVSQLGFKTILAEGADHVLAGRSPNVVYRPPDCPDTSLLLKNYRLSDDIAFRFSNQDWAEWPLSAEKFARWVDRINRDDGYTVNLFMDYETLGEHQWAETGIFEFFEQLPEQVLASGNNDFRTPSQIAAAHPPADRLDVPHMISWADTERDLSAWLGNAMQANALHELYRAEAEIKAQKNPALLTDWRKLQSSDHFYYMCTKYFADGDVHKYFNPYESPYDSYINFMNVLNNLRARLGVPEPVS
jgi:alpha-amylase